jgi:hypothetical protein
MLGGWEALKIEVWKVRSEKERAKDARHKAQG